MGFKRIGESRGGMMIGLLEWQSCDYQHLLIAFLIQIKYAADSVFIIFFFSTKHSLVCTTT